MILLTGGYGFVGKHLAKALKSAGEPFVISDPRAPHSISVENVLGSTMANSITAVFGLGAISDTTCEDERAILQTNVLLPVKIATFCTEREIPFIYASSASVYGNGDGPLNLYAKSKDEFDRTADASDVLGGMPKHWYGLRFFNVYGPGEAHKGKQASMVSQMIAGANALFDIEAKRDFIHVDDVVSVMIWLWRNLPASGIYDVGTGVARDFRAIPKALGKTFNEVPMPDSLKGKYQFHTQANLTKLRAAGYDKPFLTLEEGIARMLVV